MNGTKKNVSQLNITRNIANIVEKRWLVISLYTLVGFQTAIILHFCTQLFG